MESDRECESDAFCHTHTLAKNTDKHTRDTKKWKTKKEGVGRNSTSKAHRSSLCIDYIPNMPTQFRVNAFVCVYVTDFSTRMLRTNSGHRRRRWCANDEWIRCRLLCYFLLVRIDPYIIPSIDRTFGNVVVRFRFEHQRNCLDSDKE